MMSQNICVDQEFVHLLAEVKEIKSIEIKHGRIMQVGKPRRRRRRRKPKPKPEAENTNPSTKQQPLHTTGQDISSKEAMNTESMSISMTNVNDDGKVMDNSEMEQVLLLAPPPGGIVRESLILGQEVFSKEIGHDSV